MQVREFHYRIGWRSRSAYPGHHRSTQVGAGVEFQQHTPLIRATDPRRFDVRASLRDPFGQIMIRVYQQTSTIPVYALVDLSASLGFHGEQRKLDTLAEFIACLGYSTYRTGDPFAVIGCDRQIREEFLLPLTRSKAAGPEIAARIQSFVADGRSSEGLLAAAELLSQRRALVFLISDFYFPPALLEKTMTALAYHDVVPVILADRAEYENLPNFGFARLVDQETGQRRTLFMRPALQRRIRAQFEQHRQAVTKRLITYGRAPLIIDEQFDPDLVTRYFYENE